jgi:hypothetical protein
VNSKLKRFVFEGVIVGRGELGDTTRTFLFGSLGLLLMLIEDGDFDNGLGLELQKNVMLI